MNKILLISLSLFITAQSLKANDDKYSNADSIRSEVDLKEVVVQNNRLNNTLTNFPAKVSLISKDLIDFQMPQTAADLLGLNGNVAIQKSQLGGGSPMIRGFATNRLLYTVDGVRMNNAIFRAGNLQNVISLDPFATQSADIIFGPNSVLYGSDAIGGVMNFTTLRPRLSRDANSVNVQGKATMRYSSANNEKTAHFDVNVGFKEWAFLTSYSHFDFSDLRQGSHGPDSYLKKFIVVPLYNKKEDQVIANPNPLLQSPSGYSQDNLMQKILYSPSDNLSIQYAFHYSETSSYPRYDRLIVTDKSGQPKSAVWNYGPQKWMMNLLSLEHLGNNILYDKMTIRLAHQYFEESRIDRKFGADKERTQLEKVYASSINADFSKQLQDNLNLYYGAEYVYDKVKSTATELLVETQSIKERGHRYPDSDWMSSGLYSSVDYSPLSYLTLAGGIRYSYNYIKMNFPKPEFALDFANPSTNKYGALSGSFGVILKPVNNWHIRLNYSRGFRAANVDDMGKTFDSQKSAVTVPNDKIKPEYADNIELGIARVSGKYITFDISTYYTHLTNAIVRRDFTVQGKTSVMYKGELSKVMAMQNASSADIYGVDFNAKALLSEGWSIQGAVSYQMGKEVLEDGSKGTLPHVSPIFGNLRLQYETNKLIMQVYGVFQGEMSPKNMPEDKNPDIYVKDSKGELYAPSWATLNIKSMYKLTDKISISAALENITDQRYRVYRSGISSSGRNFVISSTYTF